MSSYFDAEGHRKMLANLDARMSTRAKWKGQKGIFMLYESEWVSGIPYNTFLGPVSLRINPGNNVSVKEMTFYYLLDGASIRIAKPKSYNN